VAKPNKLVALACLAAVLVGGYFYLKQPADNLMIECGLAEFSLRLQKESGFQQKAIGRLVIIRGEYYPLPAELASLAFGLTDGPHELVCRFDDPPPLISKGERIAVKGRVALNKKADVMLTECTLVR
jgi:hypothetical protein